MENSTSNSTCQIPRWQIFKSRLNNLHPKQFLAMMEEDTDIQLIDVRTPAEFASFHLPNAQNIDYLGENFWEQMETLDSSKITLVYCRTGRRSVRTCTLMRNGGFDNAKIFNLDGGIVVWEEVFGIT